MKTKMLFHSVPAWSHTLEEQETCDMHSRQTKFKDHKVDKWVKSHENTLIAKLVPDYKQNYLIGKLNSTSEFLSLGN